MAVGAAALAKSGFTPLTQDPPPPVVTPVTAPVVSGNEPPAPVVTPPPVPPVSGEPPVTPPSPAATPGDDFYKAIAGGKFKSTSEIDEHIQNLEKESKKDPFVNKYVKGLNDAIRNGIDPKVYEKVASIELDKLSPKELLVLRHQMENKISAEDAELLVNETYRLDDTMFSDTDPATKAARIRAGIEANSAKDFLSQYIDDELTPPIEKQIQQQVEAWTPVIPQVMDSMKTIKITAKSGNYEFPVSAETLEAANKLLNEVIGQGMTDAMPDKEGLEFARVLVEKEVMSRELANIIDTMTDAQKTAEALNKHNPRVQTPVTTPPPDDKQGLYDMLRAARGMPIKQS